MAVAVPDHPTDTRHALCLSCNYDLYGLTESRCPECGRRFDPGDPWSMNVGRPLGPIARRLLTRTGRPSRRVYAVSAAAIVWGLACFPGTFMVAVGGGIALCLLLIYAFARELVRGVVQTRYRQPERRPTRDERVGRVDLLLAALVVSSLLGAWPLRVHLFLNRPLRSYADQVYTVSPMIDPPQDHFVGTVLVRETRPAPEGVSLSLFGGATLIYSPDPSDSRPGWAHLYGPWYLGGW